LKIPTLEQLENAIERIDGNYIQIGAPIEVELVDYLKKAEASDTYVTKAEYAGGGGVDSSTFLTKSEASETYLAKTDKANSAATADALTTRRVIYIADYSKTNQGPGVFFSGAANVTIKMPNDAVFNEVTATNLILGSTASTTEGAMWLDTSFNPPRLMLRYNGVNYYTNFNTA